MKREEIKKEDKWALDTIYQNESEFNKEYKHIKKQVEEFKQLEKNFLDSKDTFYNCLNKYFEIEKYLDKMLAYTSHNFDTDITNNKNQELKDKVYNLYDLLSQNSSFIEPKILNSKNIDKYLKEHKSLKEEYGFVLEKILKEKPHTLSLEEEKLISKLAKAMSNTSQIASMMSNSDLSFGHIKDEKGKEVELTDTNYSLYISSKDRQVRKSAFEKLFQTYKQFNNTYSLLLSDYVKKNRAISDIRNFNSALEASLFIDNIDIKVYNNLIDVVSSNLDKLYKYYKVKKEALKLDEMHLYDTYLDISQKEKKYTYEEAKNLVLKSLQILGKDYTNNLQKAFNERWIDVYPNKGKIGGAYSGGAYLTKPFLLLNFKGLYHDVSTLAHELGHSMHTFYACQNNPYQYSGYSIFVAEVASQVNELLFDNYMLENAKTKDEKINILNQILELFKASIFRQTMFAEFEKAIALKEQNEEILTAEVLNNTYLDLVKKYFGPSVIIDEAIKYEWQRIPHFYYNFYVYKYSTSLAAACHITKLIINKENNALENYLNFLKTGGSKYPLDALKVAGVDLTRKEVIQSAMDMFENYLNEFNRLLKEDDADE